MTLRYHPPTWRRALNRLVIGLLGFGLMPRRYHVLTVRRRKTGLLQSTPVSVMSHNGLRWLVSPYGEGDWVRNVRAAGAVTLSRGGRAERVSVVEETAPAVIAPVLKLYLTLEPTTGKFFRTRRDDPVQAFAAEAAAHPVFRVVGL